MGRFALKGNFPMLEWIYSAGPMILLKVGDRQIEIVKAKRFQKKYFMMNDGIFELDGEYENRMNGQSFYIYNMYNTKPISIDGIEELQKEYREGNMSKVYRETERVYNAITQIMTTDKDKSFTNPIKVLQTLEETRSKDSKGTLSKETQKFLVDYKFFDKSDMKLQNIDRMLAKKINGMLSYRVMTTGPILLMSLIAMGIIGFMTMFNPLKIFPALGNSVVNSVGSKFILLLELLK